MDWSFFYFVCLFAILKMLIIELKYLSNVFYSAIKPHDQLTVVEKNQRGLILMSIFAYSFLIVNSITTASFTSIFNILLGFMFMGFINQSRPQKLLSQDNSQIL